MNSVNRDNDPVREADPRRGAFPLRGADQTRGADSDSRRGLPWSAWRLTVNQEQAEKTFKKMGCVYCLGFFVFGKFICLALLFALPSIMIGMGAFYINDCPIAPLIPVYLIVLGCYGIVETIIYGLRTCLFCDHCEIPLFVWEFSKCIIFGYFAWGSVGIFKIYPPNYDPNKGSHCDKALYLFSFGVAIILWICMSLFFLMCLLLVILVACGKEDVFDGDQRQEAAARREEQRQERNSRSEGHPQEIKK